MARHHHLLVCSVRVSSVDCGLWIVDCGVWSVDCGLSCCSESCRGCIPCTLVLLHWLYWLYCRILLFLLLTPFLFRTLCVIAFVFGMEMQLLQKYSRRRRIKLGSTFGLAIGPASWSWKSLQACNL